MSEYVNTVQKIFGWFREFEEYGKSTNRKKGKKDISIFHSSYEEKRAHSMCKKLQQFYRRV